MLKRRNLMMLGLGSSLASIIIPKMVTAHDNGLKNLEGNIIYTAENTGRWGDEKIASHLPKMEKKGTTLTITTDHTMEDFNHYIVKHRIFDRDFNYIDEYIFTPGDEKAVSEFDIDSRRDGKIFALSVCNLHDSWLNVIDKG